MICKLRRTGHKILVFSTSVKFLNLAAAVLSAYKIGHLVLSGEVDVDVRHKMIKQFNEEENMGIFLISTRAGGVGINLQAADTVIFYDCDWNPQVDLQGRILILFFMQQQKLRDRNVMFDCMFEICKLKIELIASARPKRFKYFRLLPLIL